MPTQLRPTTKQTMFTEMVLGALIYSVIFGFFNDYTNILYTASYSTTFLAAIIMQVLIYPTFKFKGWITKWFGQKSGKGYKLGMVISVWAVMFLSKFMFLGALNFIFGESIDISGFAGLVLIIICATVLTKVTQVIYTKLGD